MYPKLESCVWANIFMRATTGAFYYQVIHEDHGPVKGLARHTANLDTDMSKALSTPRC